MNSQNNVNVLILLILSTFLLVQTKAKYCSPFLANYHVHIIDDLPPNDSQLLLHCVSKDDDLGNHTFHANNFYKFEFCETFFHTTHFRCGFTWHSKYVNVDVYRSKARYDCASFTCYWSARSDGIYFTGENPPKNWVKRYNWP